MNAAERVAVALTAWLDHMEAAGTRQQVEQIARVLCDYAGRFAWMASMEDPAGAVRYAVSQCEQSRTALHGIELTEDASDDMLDAVSSRIEGEQLAFALQQLADMGVRRVSLDFPRLPERVWLACGTGPSFERVSLTGTASEGTHSLLQRLAVAIGSRLRQSGRGRLDS